MPKYVSIKRAVLAFGASAKEACRHPRCTVEKYGINIASFVYILGSGVQGHIGLTTDTWNDIGAGVLNGSGCTVSLMAGHTSAGIAISFLMTVPAVVLARWEGMEAHDLGAFLSLRPVPLGRDCLLSASP